MADLARSAGGLRSVQLLQPQLELLQRAAMSLDGEDISDEVLQLVQDAFSSEPIGPKLLEAFWANYSISLSPIDGARLIVNPPSGIEPGVDQPVTLSCQKWLSGRYGLVLDRLPSSVEMMNVKSENHGFFDDVTVFWDLGVPVKELCGFVLPGSTVTLVRPNQKVHGKWMAVAGLDLAFSGLTEVLESQFKLTPLVQSGPADVHSITLGVESK